MVYKCKMCGGDIEKIDGENIGKCLYCKSVMTLPNSTDEKIINLYNRASELRQSNEFDRALELYNKILDIDNDQIEARWGSLLCRYGVEYVDDDKTNSKIPTCHRTNRESIFSTEEFKNIISKAYGDSLEIYKKEANRINEIQKEILKISENEDPYDIFICYKETDEIHGGRTKDSVLAQNIYNELNKLGYKVFFSRITLEDKLGTEYEPYIFNALNSAKVMLVVGTSKNNFNSIWVKNEWSRYLEIVKKDNHKIIIPCFSDMSVENLPNELSLFQGQDLNKIGAIQDLVHGISKIVEKNDKNNIPSFSSDMYSQFKSMLEEEEKKKQEEERKRLEEINGVPIKIYKETFKPGCKFLMFFISFCIAIVYFISYTNNFLFSFSNDFYKYLFRSEIIVLFFVTGIIYLIAFILSICNRHTMKISKNLYILNLIIYLVFNLIFYFKYSVSLNIIFLIVYGLTIILYFLNPEWNIDYNNVSYVNKNLVSEYEKKNKEIEVDVTSKPKLHFIKFYSVFIVFSVILFIILIMTVNNTLDNYSLKNPKVDQIYIINDYINVRNSSSTNDKKIAVVLKNEYYRVLDVIDGVDTTDDGAWYYIEISKNVFGYVYGGDDGEYVSFIEGE